MGEETAKLVSVVVPTCNRAKQIDRCLSALTEQTYRNFEVIVIDDGSTDGTTDRVRALSESRDWPALQLIVNETNLGANPSRNRGIAAAQGELVAFLDDDCIPEPGWLKEIVGPFEDPNVGAVVGGVSNVPARNLYELTLKGTQLIPRRGPARRIISCNMCVRRELLLQFGFDTDRPTQALNRDGSVDMTVSGRGDEEGLYLQLKSAGHEALALPSARVAHDHPYARRSFFRQAYRSGRSAARLVYKYRLPPRIDLAPFMAAYATLPLALWRLSFVWGFVGFFLIGVAAIVYNDLFRKRKTLAEVAITFPLLLVYYHLRLLGYVREAILLRVRKNEIERVRLARASPPRANSSR